MDDKRLEHIQQKAKSTKEAIGEVDATILARQAERILTSGADRADSRRLVRLERYDSQKKQSA